MERVTKNVSVYWANDPYKSGRACFFAGLWMLISLVLLPVMDSMRDFRPLQRKSHLIMEFHELSPSYLIPVGLIVAILVFAMIKRGMVGLRILQSCIIVYAVVCVVLLTIGIFKGIFGDSAVSGRDWSMLVARSLTPAFYLYLAKKIIFDLPQVKFYCAATAAGNRGEAKEE